MDLQSYLISKFESWRPPPPRVEGRSKSDVTLRWEANPFAFLKDDLLYWVQKKEKLPPWVVVYSGGKTTKRIDNLPPQHPHTFRLKVILKATAVSTLSDKALEFFGDEKSVRDCLERHIESKLQIEDIGFVDEKVSNKATAAKIIRIVNEKSDDQEVINDVEQISNEDKDAKVIQTLNVDFSAGGDNNSTDQNNQNDVCPHEGGGDVARNNINMISNKSFSKKWLESEWSDETTTSTDTDGSSAVCFCMAVRCGYLKQVQAMLEERPALLEIINSKNGFTPLATAVRKGDLNTVRFLLAAGADVDAASASGQTSLHLAALGARADILDVLLDKGADFQARDLNGLRVEHYAVDSGCRATTAHVLARGGDVRARDRSGWTPLFRAVSQGAPAPLVELLVAAGSDLDAADSAGLTLACAARLLTDRHGRSRDSILRLVDAHYPHEKAVANFTRLTRKISRLRSVYK